MDRMGNNHHDLAHEPSQHRLVIVLKKAMDEGGAAVSLAMALDDLAIWASDCGLQELEHLIGVAAVSAHDHATVAGQPLDGRLGLGSA